MKPPAALLALTTAALALAQAERHTRREGLAHETSHASWAGRHKHHDHFVLVDLPSAPDGEVSEQHGGHAGRTLRSLAVPIRDHLDDQPSWTVEQVETAPMSAQQYTDAVAALAALIAQWQTNSIPKQPERK